MRELGHGGRTLVFVSHNMAAIENLCHRVIWISDGKIVQDGDAKDVIRGYLNSFGAAEERTIDLLSIRERTGTGAVRLLKMEFLDQEGAECRVVHSGDPLRVRFDYECRRDIPNLHFGLRIYSSLGVLVSDVHTWSTSQAIPLAPQGKGSIELNVDFLNLMPGNYYLSVWASSLNEWHDVIENVAMLEIEPSDYYGSGRGIEARFGLVFFPFRWTAGERRSCGEGAANRELLPNVLPREPPTESLNPEGRVPG
jgi:lipopolysaccharide transport system ATP-binding protein